MKAAKTVFLCSNCGNETPRWQGRCPSCGQWNTLEEYTPPQAAAPSRSSLSNRTSAARGVGVQPKRLNEVTSGEELRFGTGLSELDRVLGGGAVRGSLVLVSGAPGIGKSTLLLQICAQICREQTILYVSGEESENQLKLRAERLGALLGGHHGHLRFQHVVLQRCGEISRVFLGALGRLLDRIGSHLSLRARHGHGSLGLLVSQLRGRLGLIVQVARGRLSLTGRLADRGLGLLAHALGGGLSLFQHLGVDGLALLHGDLALGDELVDDFLGLLARDGERADAREENVFETVTDGSHENPPCPRSSASSPRQRPSHAPLKRRACIRAKTPLDACGGQSAPWLYDAPKQGKGQTPRNDCCETESLIMRRASAAAGRGGRRAKVSPRWAAALKRCLRGCGCRRGGAWRGCRRCGRCCRRRSGCGLDALDSARIRLGRTAVEVGLAHHARHDEGRARQADRRERLAQDHPAEQRREDRLTGEQHRDGRGFQPRERDVLEPEGQTRARQGEERDDRPRLGRHGDRIQRRLERKRADKRRDEGHAHLGGGHGDDAQVGKPLLAEHERAARAPRRHRTRRPRRWSTAKTALPRPRSGMAGDTGGSGGAAPGSR